MKALVLAVILLTSNKASDPGAGSERACHDGALRRELQDLVSAAAVSPGGEVLLTREPVDRRFAQPFSGAYFQISAAGQEPFGSQSLWDRKLRIDPSSPVLVERIYESDEFERSRLRVAERIVRLPSSPLSWRFQVAFVC